MNQPAMLQQQRAFGTSSAHRGDDSTISTTTTTSTTAASSTTITAAPSPPPLSPSSPSSASASSLVGSIRSLRDSTTSPQSPPSPAAAFRGTRRKPIPSPLQQTSAVAGLPHSPQSPVSSYQDEPRSPREKLDALIASEASDEATPTQTFSPTSPNQASRAPVSGKLSSYAQLRNVSAPIQSSVGISPPSSPVAMPPPSRTRPDVRPTAPRNPSIDSAVSSLSSNASQSYRSNVSHSYKSSQDGSSVANPPDPAALIAAAGSPEAALLAIWKEKQSASNHNSQLWRLVEKQRAMILGLNKDLERALKDKERYRKKLKEYTNHVPPLPNATQRSEAVVERDESQSPAPSEKQDDVLPSASNSTKPGERAVSPLAQAPALAQAVPEMQLAQSPAPSSGAASGPSSSLNSPTDYSVKPLALAHKGLGLDAVASGAIPSVTTVSEPTRNVERVAPQGHASKPSSDNNNLKTPGLSLTQATPIIGQNGFDSPREKPVHPLRKPPPAPLDLSRPKQASAHLHQAAAQEDTDSDYDDTLEVDEIPVVERGRRKTREEDDRVREAMILKEEEARSKSKKKKSESKSKAGSETTSPSDGKPPPSGSLSPRPFNPLTAGLPLSPRHPPPSSLNALLSPTNSDSSTVAQRGFSSPLMSPGLPLSPRPSDRPLGSPLPRNPRQALASPPMSPRTGGMGLPPQSARAPRQPVPQPPGTPQSYSPPQGNRPDVAAQAKQGQQSGLLRPPNAHGTLDGEDLSSDPSTSESVYRGLVSDQYPGLLLPPNALPSIDVKVFSSRLQPSRLSFMAPKSQEEDPVFILAIYARSDGKQLWRVEKTIMALPHLDQQLKSLCDFHGKLPDRALFSGHAPAKIDARRAALNSYFDAILETPMSEKAALHVCEFFSNDVLGAQNDEKIEATSTPASTKAKGSQRKEGYLTKRGKNFGGWKARYFVLEGAEFRYYETQGGAHLGTIKLQNAQIGKQSQQQANQSPQRRDDSEDNQYRHAFLILEPKRKDSSSLVRHVLCAESDDERDAWVEALLQHVDYQEQPSPTDSQKAASSKSNETARPKKRESPDLDRGERLQGLSYDDTVAAEAPIRGPSSRDAKDAHTNSPKSSSFSGGNSGHYAISNPTNGAPIQDAESWGNKMLAPTSVKDKKRSIFGFRGRGSSDLAPGQILAQPPANNRDLQNRNIFGAPLQEAVEFTRPLVAKNELPAVVYRCLEYLRAKKASNEEGIFRLSGSNIVIKALRDRFNNEGDVKLLDGQYYDVHAVASLLKLYLRELPASILTREFHLDFLKVLDLDEREKKIQSFNVLVHKLPRVNYDLIQALSGFLIEIIDNADVNKMTVRNVGIVFAPTLNIPAPLISMFLTDYDDIFGEPIDEAISPIREITITAPSLSSDAIRSPRHQMFSDLPTPAYNATSFQQHPSSFSMAQNPQQAPYPQQPQQQSGYDVGFIPLHPSYDAPIYQQPVNSEGYGSLNGALHPGSAMDTKQKRRESGMLLMNMNLNQQRKLSQTRQGDPNVDRRMVQEESAFD